MNRIFFLGTGGMMPTKFRHTFSTFIHYNGKGILFDACENVQRQFRLANLSVTQIDYIFFTHLHGDHVLGLPGILLSLENQNYNRKLTIFGPIGFKEFVKKVIDTFAIQLDFPFEVVELEGSGKIDLGEFEIHYIEGFHQVPVLEYSFKEKDKIKLDKEKLKELTGLEGHKKFKLLKEGKAIEIDGKIIKPEDVTFTQRGLKVTIITDTLFREEFIDFARNSDILIAEASFVEKDKEKAKEHFHLTLNEVKRIFLESNSKLLALSHVSPRYQGNLGEIIKELRGLNKPWIIAEDLDYILYYKRKLEYRREEIILHEILLE